MSNMVLRDASASKNSTFFNPSHIDYDYNDLDLITSTRLKQSFQQDTAELFFEDLRVPKSALLGKENHGFYFLMDQLSQERVRKYIFLTKKYWLQIGCANEELARAEAMFELTRDWVRERKAFGKRVADLQTVLRLFRRFSQFFWKHKKLHPLRSNTSQQSSRLLSPHAELSWTRAFHCTTSRSWTARCRAWPSTGPPTCRTGWPESACNFTEVPNFSFINTMSAQVGVSCGRLRSLSATLTQGCRPSTLALMRS